VSKTTKLIQLAAACSVLAIGSGIALQQVRAAAVSSAGSHNILAMRRLTEAQYRRSIADVFSPTIKISGRFEPEVRRDGLIAVGSSSASISASGMEQYYAMASGISAQVTGPAGRKTYLSCTPAAANKPDDACAATVFSHYGRLLYRRPLDDGELKGLVSTARTVSTKAGDFYAGIEETLSLMLTSPQFLFRVERAGGPAKDGAIPLDAYSRASRLSFLTWNAAPDDALLAAAQRGDLDKPAGLQAQVDRLTASPRLADGMGAFFDDMMQLDLFRSQTKDAAKFPKYNQVIADESRQQTLKTILNLLVANNGDYRDIFTTRDTVMTRNLALVYQVPYTSNKDWAPYTFPENLGRSGVLTQISFLSLFAHPAVSSPTKRGLALNEIFLCQTVPPPPENVDFSAVNAAPDRMKTVRLRLEMHATEPACVGCHSLMDPLGLSLEKFDALGQRRETEDGEKIDVAANYLGKKFEGATGLGLVLHDNPKTTTCVVRNLYAAGVGHAPTAADKKTMDGLNKTFADGGYRLPALLKVMATSEAFYSAPQAPKAAPAPLKVAAATPTQENK
jgi:hypothetical protein